MSATEEQKIETAAQETVEPVEQKIETTAEPVVTEAAKEEEASPVEAVVEKVEEVAEKVKDSEAAKKTNKFFAPLKKVSAKVKSFLQ